MQRFGARDAFQRFGLATVQTRQQGEKSFVLDAVFVKQLFIQFRLRGPPIQGQAKRHDLLPGNGGADGILAGISAQTVTRDPAGFAHIAGKQFRLDPDLRIDRVFHRQGREFQQLRHRLRITSSGQTCNPQGNQGTAITAGLVTALVHGRQRRRDQQATAQGLHRRRSRVHGQARQQFHHQRFRRAGPHGVAETTHLFIQQANG